MSWTLRCSASGLTAGWTTRYGSSMRARACRPGRAGHLQRPRGGSAGGALRGGVRGGRGTRAASLPGVHDLQLGQDARRRAARSEPGGSPGRRHLGRCAAPAAVRRHACRCQRTTRRDRATSPSANRQRTSADREAEHAGSGQDACYWCRCEGRAASASGHAMKLNEGEIRLWTRRSVEVRLQLGRNGAGLPAQFRQGTAPDPGSAACCYGRLLTGRSYVAQLVTPSPPRSGAPSGTGVG